MIRGKQTGKRLSIVCGRKKNIHGVFLVLLCATLGCVRAATSVAEPTALEMQLIGPYQELDRDLMYASSFRGGDKKIEEDDVLYQEAVRARRIQLFNQQDIQMLKDYGCIGENRLARLSVRKCDSTSVSNSDEVLFKIIPRLVSEENQSRSDIEAWAAEKLAAERGNKKIERADRIDVYKSSLELFRSALKPGHWWENDQGQWQRHTQDSSSPE